VGDHDDLGRVDPVAVHEAVPRGDGHRDHGVRERDHLFEHLALMDRGCGQHGMGDHDYRYPHGREHLEHLVAVLAAVDSVLVLDDRQVERVEGVSGALVGAGGAVEVGHDVRTGRSGRPVNDPHDTAPAARSGTGQAVQHRRGERREATLRGRVRTEKSIGDRHQRTTFR
jgi:hypothetical protein